MKISIVVAVAENGVIGKNNQLPWRLSSDLKHFKKLTTGHAVLMGRKTYESIGRPLPKRTNLIVTRNQAYQAAGCEVFTSIDQALEFAQKSNETEVFIIGGAQIYQQILPKVDTVYLTKVKAEVVGDAYFDLRLLDQFKTVNTESVAAGEKDEFAFEIVEMEHI
ncbi:MAG TPA: diacylglycerol kinase [Microscillaceae bacterium]|nr:diacylglycerol kinase [Microscillaceae bacterium]